MALPHSKNIMEYPARYQFQPYAPCAGSSTCTDTCIQMIVEYYKDKTYSLSYIRKVAQSRTSFDERPCTGINYVEVLNALKAFGIYHYRVGWGANASAVATKTMTGPTLVGVHYGSYPNWPRRCTMPHATHGGRTQCSFRGTHAVLAIKRSSYNGKAVILTRDPNHHSSARPEHPTYDRFTLGQLNTTMLNLPKYSAFSKTYMIYPTKRK